MKYEKKQNHFQDSRHVSSGKVDILLDESFWYNPHQKRANNIMEGQECLKLLIWLEKNFSSISQRAGAALPFG